MVLAEEAEDVMEPLTRLDENREWHQRFTRVGDDVFAGSGTPSDERYASAVQWRAFVSPARAVSRFGSGRPRPSGRLRGLGVPVGPGP